MEALLHHQKANECCHTTSLVLSNTPNISGLEKATAHNICTEVVEIDSNIPNPQEQRESHEKNIIDTLQKYNIEAVILSGYMRILSPFFVRKWTGRLLNIHPSLLPKYPGAHAHRDALADGATVSGCTVHLVDEGVDTGQILAQKKLQIDILETEETLSERVKKLEHQLYPEVIDAYAKGELYLG